MSSLAAAAVLLPALLGAPPPADTEVREFLAVLGKDLAAGDARAIVRRLDPGALAEQVRRHMLGDTASGGAPELDSSALESAFVLWLSRSPRVLLAKSHEVASVVPVEGSDDALAVTRYWAPGGLVAIDGEAEPAILRWRIRRVSEGLRIADVEDVPTGVELSLEVWLDVLNDGAAEGGASLAARRLREALRELKPGALDPAPSSRSKASNDIESATRKVAKALLGSPRDPKRVPGDDALSAPISAPQSFPDPLPAGLSVLRWRLASIEAAGEERWTDVLVALRRAETSGEKPLVVLRLRARALNGLGRHEAAVAPAREYLSLAGDGPESCLELGRALLAAGQTGKALPLFRRGLERDFDSEELLLGLARALPESSKEELRGALRKASKGPLHALLWKRLLETLLDESEAEAASIVFSEAPRNTDGLPMDLYMGRILAAQGSTREAAEVLEKTLASEPGEDAERDGHDAYLEVMRKLEKPLEAYRRVKDKEYAFSNLAEHLDEPASFRDLQALIEEHAMHAPDDPWLFYYQGLAAMERQDLATARRSFEKGLSLADEDDESWSALREKLVLAFYEGREGLAALDSVPPIEDTFEDLAGFYCSDDDARGLDDLLDTYRRKAPTGGSFHWWEADLCQHEGKYDVGAATLMVQREKILAARQDPAAFEKKLVRCLVESGRDAEALEEARRSRERDGNPWLEVFVHARAGRVSEAVRAMAECVDLGFARESDFFEDAEIGGAISREAFRLLREAHAGK